MDNLFGSTYFVGDVQRVNMYICVAFAYFIEALIIYVMLILIAELVYFVKCKICKEAFDYKVVIHTFTDF